MKIPAHGVLTALPYDAKRNNRIYMTGANRWESRAQGCPERQNIDPCKYSRGAFHVNFLPSFHIMYDDGCNPNCQYASFELHLMDRLRHNPSIPYTCSGIQSAAQKNRLSVL